MVFVVVVFGLAHGLNESPSEKEGKSLHPAILVLVRVSLNESPSEKEGKSPTP